MFYLSNEPLNANICQDVAQRQGEDPHGACRNGLFVSADWEVYVDGEPITIYGTPVTRGGPHSFGRADFREGERRSVVIKPQNRKIYSVLVAPKHLGVEVELADNEMHFEIDRECHLTFTVNEDIDRPLTLSFLKPIPMPDEPCRVIPAGVYEFDFYDFSDGETLYLEDGAILRALPHKTSERPIREKDWAGKPNYRKCLAGDQKRNITILGYGMIDFSWLDWHERNTMSFTDCENLHIEGLTLVNAGSWNLTLMRCNQVEISRVRIFGYRENSDGIDIVSSQNVRVHDCFLRTGDDAIAVKAMCPPPVCGGRNIRCYRNVVWNDKVRCFGIAAESQNDITNVQFTDSDVIRSYADWTHELGSLVVYICDRAHVSDILFENIRIEHEKKFACNVLIQKDFWSKDHQAGCIDGVIFRNIDLAYPVPSCIKGYDSEHDCRNIAFEQYRIAGTPCKTVEEAGIQLGDYVQNVTVKTSCSKMSSKYDESCKS